jgi:hypothetical protein
MGETLVTRLLLILAAALLAGCTSAPAPSADPSKDAAYRQLIDQLNTMNRDANNFFKTGKPDQAAALIEKGQPLVKRLLDAPHPTLEAVEAAADLDDLYGRMLLSNRHYGWAMLQFQKNHARWKTWTPATPETTRRLQEADRQIAECDRLMTQ